MPGDPGRRPPGSFPQSRAPTAQARTAPGQGRLFSRVGGVLRGYWAGSSGGLSFAHSAEGKARNCVRLSLYWALGTPLILSVSLGGVAFSYFTDKHLKEVQ